PIELLNVSFAGAAAPDRQTARMGVRELVGACEGRRWHLVEVDSTLSEVDQVKTHLLSLLCPSHTHMDLNIGAALWLAARGEGRMIRYGGEGEGDGEEEEEVCRAVMGSAEVYRAHARVVFVGTGADEHWPSLESEMRDDVQRLGRRNLGRDDRWPSLESEMRDDMQRLWRRNLGRDDRCLSDHGREVSLKNDFKPFLHCPLCARCHQPRFPFLDEGVMSALLALPLPRIANLHLPPGTGDKLILRQVRAKIKTNTRD
ncbi:unnamed protein product, partial [Closterium sp. NIES-65]